MADVKTPSSGAMADIAATDMVQLETPPAAKKQSARSPSRFGLRKSSGSSSSSDSTGSPRRKVSLGGFDMPSVRHTRPNTIPGVAPKTIVAGGQDDSNATPEQRDSNTRSNYIALLLVATYIAVSILFYHFVEDWTVVDCIYFAMVIVTTVGYGDVIPLKTAGKAFTLFFAFYGIVTIGMALGRLANWFLSRQQELAKQTTARLLHSVDSAADHVTGSHGQDPATAKATSVAVKDAKNKTKIRLPAWLRWVLSDSNKAICWALVPIAASIGGGLILGAIEGWDILDCFYYAIITVTTVGFGDFSPKSQAGRIFAIFYLPLAVVSVASGIGAVLEELGRRKVMKSKISMKELLAMDSDGDGKVSQMEYLSYMLVKLGKADQGDIDGILAQFRKLDKDGSGELDKDDLERLDRHLQRQHEQQEAQDA